MAALYSRCGHWQSKKMLNSNTSSTCPPNTANFSPLAAEIGPVVWGTQANFKGVSRLSSVTARHSSSGRQPNFAALNRERHLYSAGRPSRWALAHNLVLLSSFFFSSPNLSRRRLDVCHTSTHGVALVRISDADLKPAARGSLKHRTQKSRQKSPSVHHRTNLSGYIFATVVWGTPANFNGFLSSRRSGRQPNFAALNRGRHWYSAGWPSCWASARILV